MSLPEQIQALIERFSEHKDSYRSAKYNETQLRREFLDPFFEALGWDVFNKQGHAETYKEVIHEDAVKVKGKTGDSTKAPDYSFRVGGQRKFFVEAKKPSIYLKDNIDSAYQIRRYGWSAGLSLSILTDFEEFAVYDTSIKPKSTDAASVARIFYCTYDEYEKHIPWIISIFSKDAILKGSFDQFAKESKGKKGTTTVDKEFLKEIESWRLELAKNISLRNNIDTRSLNYSVGVTIDRILFLRICEDRGIEPYEQLGNIATKENIYEQLKQLYHKADQKYNSGLFHFEKEKERNTHPDELTPSLIIDDKVLKGILKKLYYPDSPYEFSVIGADILGNVYEQFLGKVIRLSGKSAKVEEKPEVKKAGGVFYTPRYIVEYIVENTLGEKLKNLTPKDVAGESTKYTSPLRVLDPACGSGSFLIFAYQYLLDWHRDWYVSNNPEKNKKQVFKSSFDEWQLTTSEKKKILLNNIFGVDIDPQAVEVTKLNLLLKVLENESAETIESQLSMFHERALPDLENNIKCGNSLIGPDFYSNSEQGNIFDSLSDDEKVKINVFDWANEWSSIMDNDEPGFDIVIGNPPYGAELTKTVRLYLAEKLAHSINNIDSYPLFIRMSLELTKPGGKHGFIVPSTWLYMTNYYEFRNVLLSTYSINRILHFRKPVFHNATVETCIELIDKSTKLKNITYIEVADSPESLAGQKYTYSQSSVLNNPLIHLCFKGENNLSLFNKILLNSINLGSFCDIVCGLTPYRVGKGKPKQTEKIVKEKAFDSDTKIDESYKQYLMGRDFHRYKWQIEKERFLLYGENLAEPRFAAPFFDEKKIVVRQTSSDIIAHLDTDQYISLKNVHNIRIKNNLSYKYILAILNSKLINWWYHQLIPEIGRVFAEVKVVNLEKLPIHIVTLANLNEKTLYDQIISLVNRILSLNVKLADTNLALEKEQLERQITATTKEIDQIVYKLYSLSKDEVSIIENQT